MANSYEILDQTKIATADTFEDGVAAASDAQLIISTITICNTGTDTRTYSISVLPSGATQGDQHIMVKDSVIGAGDTVALTWGLTLDNSDKLRIKASGTDVVFATFGTVIT